MPIIAQVATMTLDLITIPVPNVSMELILMELSLVKTVQLPTAPIVTMIPAQFAYLISS